MVGPVPRGQPTARKEIHVSYNFSHNHSVPDMWIRSNRHYYDIVVNNCLCTMIKDEGATESFIRAYLLERLELVDALQPLGREADSMRGVGSAKLALKGELHDLQV